MKLKPKDPTTPSLAEVESAEAAPSAPSHPPVVAKKPPASSRSVVRLALGVGGGLVLVLAGVLAYPQFFSSPPPPPPPPRRPVVKKAAPPPKPAPAEAKPAATAGKTEAGKAAPEAGTKPPAAAPTPKPAAPVTPPPPPQPSQEFRQYVEQLRITGLRTGPPARLFVGGVTYQDGDVISQDLGVVFVGVDPKTQLLVFKDRTGAIIRRPF